MPTHHKKTKVPLSKISDPLSIMAHQLKNPLAVAKSYVEVVLEGELGDLNAKQKEYLQDILTNVKQMSEAVTDILDLSRIESNRYELNIIPTNLVELTEKIVASHEQWARAWGGTIVFHHDYPTPLVMTDPLKIQSVVENMIANAVHYGLPGNGKIEIRIELAKDKVVFSCADRGIGIKPEDQKKLFSKFYRSEEAVNIFPQGSGLGLYIDKIIIEKSGGKVWFKNNKDAGVTFYFSLPAVKNS